MRENHSRILCLTTPRSGSNIFCSVLASVAGAEDSHEIFNPDFKPFRTYSSHNEPKSVTEYLQNIEYKNNKSYVHKILISQLNFISGWAKFESLFDEGKIIYLKRRDIIKQAVSLFIAFETNQWTSTPNRPPLVAVDDIEYDYEKLMRVLGRIERQESWLRRLVAVFGITPIEVTYEDYLLNPSLTVQSTLHQCGWKSVVVSDDFKEKYNRQTTGKNIELYDRFIEDMRKQVPGAIKI